MARSCATAALLLVLLSTGGCFLRHVSVGDRIVGRWKTELAGFPVVVEYTDTTMGVGTYTPVPYTIDGDVIRFESEGTESRKIAFISDDIMVQTDLTTGVERTFTRESE